jgi:hypothetical protein
MSLKRKVMVPLGRSDATGAMGDLLVGSPD